jgi:hypothetical protein
MNSGSKSNYAEGLSNHFGMNQHQIQEKVRNMNWHDTHAKTDLDSKITPLTQAAYLGRKIIVEFFLE